MKKIDWKKLLKQAFSPKNEDARAQEKAAAFVLGSILVLLFLPIFIAQFIVEGIKAGFVFVLMGGGLIAQEKLGIKNKTALNVIMSISMVLSFVALMALLGFFGRMYRGL